MSVEAPKGVEERLDELVAMDQKIVEHFTNQIIKLSTEITTNFGKVLATQQELLNDHTMVLNQLWAKIHDQHLVDDDIRNSITTLQEHGEAVNQEIEVLYSKLDTLKDAAENQTFWSESVDDKLNVLGAAVWTGEPAN